eukprot:TRINITY_DN1155_c0_g2_i1.p1 TRINITY_DN1155_c0_g2~~TRINITY_DN1155_c0_g2_i1.p1  ORF type:complete len:720 (-),score=173.00 TRINITY_DN1155_c0_g2_i1:438-2597(-)
MSSAGKPNVAAILAAKKKAAKKIVNMTKPPIKKQSQAPSKVDYDEEDGSGSDDFDDDDHEGMDGYKRGGYHPVKIGDVYNRRYVVIRKMGWGHFSTVWLAYDRVRDMNVALKIQKSAQHYVEAAEDEIKILKHITSLDAKSEKNIVSLLDHFKHHGPNGTHPCMVFETLGRNLLHVMKQYDQRGMPINLCRAIAKQVLVALDFLHSKCGIIHTDLKPENIMLVDDTWQEFSVNDIPSKPQLPPPPKVQSLVTNGEASSTAPMTKSQKKRLKKKMKAAGATGSSVQSSQDGQDPIGDIAVQDLNEDEQQETDEPTQPATSDTSLGQKLDSLANDMSVQSLGDKTENSDAQALPVVATSDRADEQDVTSPEPRSGNETFTGVPLNTGVSGDDGHHEKIGQITPKMVQLGLAGIDPDAIPPDSPLAQNPLRLLKSSSALSFGKPEYSAETIQVKVVDFGNACWTNQHFADDIQTRQYRAPEVIVGTEYSTSADIWSFACLIFEILTGDYLFDPRSGEHHTKDDDHLALIIELVGKFPKTIFCNGKYYREYFNRNGTLKNITNLRYWGLEEVLHEKYRWSSEQAASFASFLMPMLDCNPITRITAEKALKHPWLSETDELVFVPSSRAQRTKFDVDSESSQGGANATFDARPNPTSSTNRQELTALQENADGSVDASSSSSVPSSQFATNSAELENLQGVKIPPELQESMKSMYPLGSSLPSS